MRKNVPATAPAAGFGTAWLERGPAASLIGLYLREYGNSMLVFVIRTSRARLVDVTGLHAYTLSADVSATSRASERLSAPFPQRPIPSATRA